MVPPPASTISEEICSFPLVAWLNIQVSEWWDWFTFWAYPSGHFLQKLEIVGVF